ncbi:hypothetical protein LCM28_05560 [Salipiger pacificus]|nr:hypothetical protein [Alloyangia pacifica]
MLNQPERQITGLMGQKQIDEWAEEVGFPVRKLYQRLRRLRQQKSGPRFVLSGKGKYAAPIYDPADLKAYFMSGEREARHDWSQEH